MQCQFEGCTKSALPFFGKWCSQSHKKLSRKKKKVQKVMLFCASCDTPVLRNPSEVSKGGKAFCPRCTKNSGETHPNWKEGQYINAGGYRVILHKKRYMLEHRHTWEQANNSCILRLSQGNIHVHHINMNKLDNRPENLVLLPGEEHGRIHRLIDGGKYEEAKCKLIKYVERQAFFLLHSECLEHFLGSSLEDILSSGTNSM